MANYSSKFWSASCLGSCAKRGLKTPARICFLLGLVCVVMQVLFCGSCDAKGESRKRGSYKGGRASQGTPLLKHTPEWERRRAKNSECRLGDKRYALNDTWSPDLGPPFGVWTCVKCTCTPVRKKRRIVARVVCRNIKNECPQVVCYDAVLLPGHCCKICPTENNDIGLKGFLKEEDAASLANRDFAVLLNGRTTRSPLLSHNLATGRLYLRRGSLRFSFVLDERLRKNPPTVIIFLNEEGEILEELEAQHTPYEINNGRLCGTWTRMPKQYRRLLMDERLWVSLSQPNEEDGIAGKISRYPGVDTEVFSALLSPASTNSEPLPGGATAIISVDQISDSLHVSLVFNGIFAQSDTTNVKIVVELVPARLLESVKDEIVLEKVYTDINKASYMTSLGEASLRLLTRGKVSMRIWATSSPHLALEGPITARATCNVFSAIVTTDIEKKAPLTTLEKGPNDVVGSARTPNYGAGWSLLSLSNEGSFEYQVRMEGLPSPVRQVSLVSTIGSRRGPRTMEDISNSYRNGWINGTYQKPTFRDLDALLRGKIEISVSLSSGDQMSGSYEPVSYTEALRSYHPTLLMGREGQNHAWLAATAWVSVDSACVTHYDVKISGLAPGVRGPITWGHGIQEDPTWSLQFRENDTIWDPRLKLNNVTLEDLVTGWEIAAHTTQLSRVSLSRLRTGATFLELSLMASSKDLRRIAVLSSKLEGIEVPASCLLEGGVATMGEILETGIVSRKESPNEGHCRGFICLDADVKTPVSKHCIDDDKNVFKDGSTWSSPLDKCQRCFCRLGRINCFIEQCPPLEGCDRPIRRPGKCCSSCPIVSGKLSEKVCIMSDESHSIGSSWHPFLAPLGFDKCITCSCGVSSNRQEPVINCVHVGCPALPCRTEDEEVPPKGECCRRCKDGSLNPVRTEITALNLRTHNAQEIADMSMNGTERRQYYVHHKGACMERNGLSLTQETLRYNGETWFPYLPTAGFVSNCFACSCKDNSIKCGRAECPTKKEHEALAKYDDSEQNGSKWIENRNRKKKKKKKKRQKKTKTQKKRKDEDTNNRAHRKRKNRRRDQRKK